MPEDTVTLERGRPVTDTELLCRADWIRLQAVSLIAQAGLGHYSSTFGVEFMEKQPQAWHLGVLNAEQYDDVVAEITARSSPHDGR